MAGLLAISTRLKIALAAAAGGAVTGRLYYPWSDALTWLLAIIAWVFAIWAVWDVATTNLKARRKRRPQRHITKALRTASRFPYAPLVVTVLCAVVGGMVWFVLVWAYIAAAPDGYWIGNLFVYREPKLVFSKMVTPNDDGHIYPIRIEDADDNAFVNFKIEYDGGLGEAELVLHELSQLGPQSIGRETTYGIRLGKDKTTKLVVHVPQNSVPTIIRVYTLSWEKP